MKWWKVKTEGEVYQSEEGNIIIVSPTNQDDFNFELKLIYDNYVREIVIKTTSEHKDKMIKMLQSESETPGKSDFNIFLK